MTTSLTSILQLLHQAKLGLSTPAFHKKQVENWIENLFNWLFITQNDYQNFGYFESKAKELEIELQSFLKIELSDRENIDLIVKSFFEEVLNIYNQLLEDLQVILEFDPAAKSKGEVVLAYPGFFAIAVYRITHLIWQHNAFILARLLSEYAHSKTGIDIHPAAKIGKKFFIDHGTGIVIGETATIGHNVKIYQGVTLGALSVSKEKQNQKRHPTIEDNVIIYANATILGGETVIGHDSTIGGNVWITASIPSYSLVYHKSEIIVKTKEVFPEALNFSI
ncbi:MAG: serine O-acetyltransferase [Raineya sp.]|jgi:serine O-acetyltransferase|nr:serine O-acetyltransferase [Raineya sp.]